MWCKRKSEIQDGGSQTGIPISQPVHNVALRFQRLYLCFQGPGIQWSYSSYCVMQAEVINPRWRLTKKGNTHFSACIQHICTILTAKHIYSRHGSSVELFSILCDAIRNKKFKMAAYTPKILTSQLVCKRSCKIPTTKLMCSRFKIWMMLFSILCNASEH